MGVSVVRAYANGFTKLGDRFIVLVRLGIHEAEIVVCCRVIRTKLHRGLKFGDHFSPVSALPPQYQAEHIVNVSAIGILAESFAQSRDGTVPIRCRDLRRSIQPSLELP